MNLSTISPAVITSGVVGLTVLAAGLILFVRTRRMAKELTIVEAWFEQELGALSQDLDTVSKQCGEYARKIAWLELRSRSGYEPKPAVRDVIATTNAKPNITERRHRVLSLARRGHDPLTIARTLGIPHGEVELMINLGKAA